jgi:hypothetical protein
MVIFLIVKEITHDLEITEKENKNEIIHNSTIICISFYILMSFLSSSLFITT